MKLIIRRKGRRTGQFEAEQSRVPGASRVHGIWSVWFDGSIIGRQVSEPDTDDCERMLATHRGITQAARAINTSIRLITPSEDATYVTTEVLRGYARLGGAATRKQGGKA